jgi:hypothetical protein
VALRQPGADAKALEPTFVVKYNAVHAEYSPKLEVAEKAVETATQEFETAED